MLLIIVLCIHFGTTPHPHELFFSFRASHIQNMHSVHTEPAFWSSTILAQGLSMSPDGRSRALISCVPRGPGFLCLTPDVTITLISFCLGLLMFWVERCLESHSVVLGEPGYQGWNPGLLPALHMPQHHPPVTDEETGFGRLADKAIKLVWQSWGPGQKPLVSRKTADEPPSGHFYRLLHSQGGS